FPRQKSVGLSGSRFVGRVLDPALAADVRGSAPGMVGDREAAEGGHRGLEGSRGPSGPSERAVHAHPACSGSSSSWCRGIVVRQAAGRCRARGGAGPEPGPRGGRLRHGAVRPVAARAPDAEPRESRHRCRGREHCGPLGPGCSLHSRAVHDLPARERRGPSDLPKPVGRDHLGRSQGDGQ
ncbi:unnamed protein product, partial [Symbiodinium microadriaticum]